jgi:hypothetical protein
VVGTAAIINTDHFVQSASLPVLSSFTNEQSHVPAIEAEFDLTPEISSVLQAFKQEVVVVSDNPDSHSQTSPFETSLFNTAFNIIQSLPNAIT